MCSSDLCQSLGHEISEEEIYLGDFDLLRAWKILPGVNLLNLISQKCMSLNNRRKQLSQLELHTFGIFECNLLLCFHQ